MAKIEIDDINTNIYDFKMKIIMIIKFKKVYQEKSLKKFQDKKMNQNGCLI